MNFERKLDVYPILTSCGCNRTPNSVHWSNLDKLIYASRNGVAIVEIGDVGSHIIASKAVHTDRVNCVRWLERNDAINLESHTFISGGVDKKLFVYEYLCTNNLIKVKSCYADSEASVVCCDGLVLDEKGYLIASASGDSHVRIYQTERDTEKAVQTLKFGNGFILTLHLAFLPNTKIPILACGGDDMKIHLLVHHRDDEMFEKVMVLPGHEDWIRGLEFASDDSCDLLLASCAQDCFVRVWRVSQTVDSVVGTQTDGDELKLKQKLFHVSQRDRSHSYSVIVETVLYGHEGWVYGVHWQPAIKDGKGQRHQPMKLLTASMDKTMIIWEPDSETGVWEERLRVGEVGGNTLGLYGCQFSPDGKTILAHGYQGAFTVWHLRELETSGTSWCRGVAIGGHFGDVTDLAWNPEGEFILSTSTDQTTRLFSPWKKDGNWYEMGRPQVHGYDLQCLAMLGRFSLASGADEKVIRCFMAPANFLENLGKLSNVDFTAEMAKRKQDGIHVAEGASVPALGLSNKAVYQDKSADTALYSDREITPVANNQYSESAFRPLELTAPPSEDNLLQNTLWPETQKLYGHGFEIFALAANPQGTRLASACKASKAEHAGIIIWDVRDWQILMTLDCHTLTVVQMEFSNCGDMLLSVSRDRTWALHHFNYDTGAVEKIAYSDKKTAVHSRIIWSCCWSGDDNYFLTASRDKKVVFWTKLGGDGDGPSCLNGYSACSQAIFSQPVTAISVAPVQDSMKRYLVAAGLESGEIVLSAWNVSEGLKVLQTLDTSKAHHLTVRRLRFRPQLGTAGCDNKDQSGHSSSSNTSIQLASCGQDHQTIAWHMMKCVFAFYSGLYLTASIGHGAYKLAQFDAKSPFDFITWIDLDRCCDFSLQSKINLMSMVAGYIFLLVVLVFSVRIAQWIFVLILTLLHIIISCIVMQNFPVSYSYWLCLAVSSVMCLMSADIIVFFINEKTPVNKTEDDAESKKQKSATSSTKPSQ